MDEATVKKIKDSFIAKYGEEQGNEFYLKWITKKMKAESSNKQIVPKPKRRTLDLLLYGD